MSSTARSGRVSVGGLGAPVLETGPGGATEAVLCLHGNPGSSEDWRALLGRTGSFARSIALDLPGYGGADKPESFEASLATYGEWLSSALDELGVRAAHLVLHDFGGGAGFALAVRRPETIRSLTLVNAGPLPGYSWHRTARMWRTPVLGELLMAITTPGVLSRAIRHENPGVPKADADRVARGFDRASKRNALRLYRATDPDPAVDWDRLRELSPPTLVVFGARDPYMDASHAQRLPQTLMPARVQILPGSGHWPIFDDPAGVAALVVPFLREQVEGPPGATPPAG